MKRCLKVSFFGLLLSQGLRAAQPIDLRLVDLFKSDIKTRKTLSFDALVKDWEEKFGAQAFFPLFSIAYDKKVADSDRYVALMAAAKLGGLVVAPRIIPFLKDSSWMLRSAALKALIALEHTQAGDRILALVEDPALVVRSEVIDAIRALKPVNAIPSLIAAINNPENYHQGKALWVPQKALLLLADWKAKEAIPELIATLDHQKDPEMRTQTLKVLEVITGIKLNSNEKKEG